MPFAIMFRRIGGRAGGAPRLLATDIASPSDAWEMVERIASTYPVSGRTGSGCSFRDREGLCEIWAEPQPG